MKKSVLLIFSLCAALLLHAQVSKTVNLTTAGTLASVLTAEEKATITDLTITGNIDARDFKTMRNALTVLANVDLTTATVVAYSGTEGTEVYKSTSQTYGANEVPTCAFYFHKYITSISIPKSVTNIRIEAFDGCMNLTSINIDETNIAYANIDGALYNKDKTILLDYPQGKKGGFVIPNSVTTIGSSAFYMCSGLTSVTIPNSVTTIEEYAFNNCNGLTSVTIPNSVTTIGAVAFAFCINLTSIVIPNSITTIEDHTFSTCSGLTSITIPTSVTKIGGYVFSDCSGLTSVIIPNSVTTIEEGVFYGCSGLTSITIPTSVTKIGDWAFYSCSGLISVIIPNSITTIGDFAFGNCRGLSSITIPNSVTTIGNYAFDGRFGLTSIRALNSTPIALPSYAVFDKVSKTIPLYVPAGSKAAYAAADVWKEFTNIIEISNDIVLSTTSVDMTNISVAKIDITTNSSWTATSNQTWITITPASGTGTGEISITAEPNTTGATRTATITVQIDGQTKSGISKTITVTQSTATTAIEDAPTTTSDLLYPNPATNYICIPTEKAARVFVYNSTGQLVLSKDIAGKEDVNIEALTAGLYKVCIETAADVAVYSVVKK